MSAIVAASRFGPMILPPHDAYVGPAIIHYGQYCAAEFMTWLPYVPEGGLVVDAGANLGSHTLAFAFAVGLAGKVVAVEPQRQLCYMLAGSAALCGARNVWIKQMALAREAGTVRVPDLDYNAPQNFGGMALRDVTAEMPSENVRADTLDSLALPRLDFLKIDVEGYELDVLHGGDETITAMRPVISAEADREQNVPAMLGWFRLHGYRVWWHKPLLGPHWPRTISVNLLGLPREKGELPDPQGDVEIAIA